MTLAVDRAVKPQRKQTKTWYNRDAFVRVAQSQTFGNKTFAEQSRPPT